MIPKKSWFKTADDSLWPLSGAAMALGDWAAMVTAVERNTPVQVAGGAAGRSRLLAVVPEGIWLEAFAPVKTLDALIAGQVAVEIAFRQDTANVEFRSKVLDRRSAYALNATLFVPAVLIEAPASTRTVQRRSAYRVSVPPDSQLTTRSWRINDADVLTDVPLERQEIRINVNDLSAGGIGGIYVRRKTDGFYPAETQRLRIELAHDGLTLLLEARLRYIGPVPDPDNRRVGIGFTFASDAPDRQKQTQLNKIIGALQRRELKRKKLR